MSLESLDSLIYIIMRLGTVALVIILQTALVTYVAIIVFDVLKKRWHRAISPDAEQ